MPAGIIPYELLLFAVLSHVDCVSVSFSCQSDHSFGSRVCPDTGLDNNNDDGERKPAGSVDTAQNPGCCSGDRIRVLLPNVTAHLLLRDEPGVIQFAPSVK